MTGSNLKEGRLRAGWTQKQAAKSLGLTQAYLSMIECGHRRVSPQVLLRAQVFFDLPPTSLPLETAAPSSTESEALKLELGAFGYPGFGYLRGRPMRNPAEFLFAALDESDLDIRVVEALPWVAWRYAVDMNWDWLVRNTKTRNRQNRLGFVVSLAKEWAAKQEDHRRATKLAGPQAELEQALLAREDTLCHESMTNAERKWLQQNRPEQAKQWNLLTDIQLDHLAYAAA
jgi:transcriptional regulator with XRE-family HTH domain